ncbi:hypothetical protein SEA_SCOOBYDOOBYDOO_251 [Mycobacterium phage ScoobyDoobyDoo]|nr:hypothetical protein SEA_SCOOBYDOOBYDOO_251 [Mycobacterium phage ScoobyDoobyDoo]
MSDEGRVWSLVSNRLMKLTPLVGSGHLRLNLDTNKTRLVHRLVLEAFVGPCPPGMETRHLDDDPSNNRLSNLCWGTRLENTMDRVQNGIHNNTRKTECSRGHKYTAENTIVSVTKTGTSRRCRTCHNGLRRERRKRTS